MSGAHTRSFLTSFAVGAVIGGVLFAFTMVAALPFQPSAEPNQEAEDIIAAIRVLPDPPTPDVPLRIEVEVAEGPKSDGCYSVAVAWTGFFSDGPGGDPSVDASISEETRGSGGSAPVPRWTPGGSGGMSGDLSGHCSISIGSFDDGTVLWVAVGLSSLVFGPLDTSEVVVPIGDVAWAEGSGPTVDGFRADWRESGLDIRATVSGDSPLAVADFALAEFSSGCGGRGFAWFNQEGPVEYGQWFPAPICEDYNYWDHNSEKVILVRGAFRDTSSRTAMSNSLLIRA